MIDYMEYIKRVEPRGFNAENLFGQMRQEAQGEVGPAFVGVLVYQRAKTEVLPAVKADIETAQAALEKWEATHAEREEAMAQTDQAVREVRAARELDREHEADYELPLRQAESAYSEAQALRGISGRKLHEAQRTAANLASWQAAIENMQPPDSTVLDHIFAFMAVTA